MLLGGCGGATVAPNTNTQVRVIDALKTTGNVGVDVNGDFNFFANNIGYGTIQPYGLASNQSQQVIAVSHGTSNVVVPAQTLTFAQNTKTTILLTGTQGSGSFPPTLTTISDNTAPPAAGDWKLRLINASQFTGGAVDIYVLAPAADINVSSPIASSIGYGGAITYVEMQVVGARNVKIVPAGQKAPILVNLSVNPAAGDVRTLLLLDNGGNISSTLLSD